MRTSISSTTVFLCLLSFTQKESRPAAGFSRGGPSTYSSQPVSRVLSRAFRPRDGHSSGTRVTARLKLPTRTRRGPRHSVPIRHCSGWGLADQRVAARPVRSYRTISPLPVDPALAGPHRRCLFCSTFRRVAPPSCYEAPCPMELGLSSKPSRAPRPPGRLK